ncbi:MAG: HAD family phosphatase [Lachnospiraceae bacterium]|nr:HAD family phosphatase [Lachnospiraceae bacterium]
MYQLIACDLDETLLQTWDKKVSQKNRDAIKKAREKGVRFVVTTGRGYETVDGTLEEIGLKDQEGQYVISFNGGAITENAGRRLMHFEGIPFSRAEELFARGMTYDVGIHVYTKDTVYVYNLSENERTFLQGRMAIEPFSDCNLDFLKGQDIVKCIYVNTDFSYLKKIESELSELVSDMEVSFSSNRYIEFNKQGVNKGNGLRRLAELLDIDMKDTIAVGDNYNDLSMIRAAGLGVGVANTVEEMKAECDYVTAATCDQSAIAEVVEKFVL